MRLFRGIMAPPATFSSTTTTDKQEIMLSSRDEDEQPQPPLLAEAAVMDEEYQAHTKLFLEQSLCSHGLAPPSPPLHRVKQEPPPPTHPGATVASKSMSRQGGGHLPRRATLLVG